MLHHNFKARTISPELRNAEFGRQARVESPGYIGFATYAYFRIELPRLVEGARYLNNVGYAVVQQLNILSNGRLIDRATGETMEMLTELNTPEGKLDMGIYAMVHRKAVDESLSKGGIEF